MPPTTQSDVLIIGAGLAGLTAALHVAERGLKPIVLEANAQYVGGRVAGNDTVEFEHQGQTWRFRGEHGVHGIWSPYRNLQAMLTRQNLRPTFIPAQEENWIYRYSNGRVKMAAVGSALRNSWIPAPLHYLALFIRPRFLQMLDIRDALSLIEVWYSLVYALGVDPLREDQPLEDQWLGDMTQHWAPALRAFMIGLIRNGLSAHPEEIPLSGFVAFMRFYTLLRRDTWAFSYMPTDGGTSLVEPLAQRIHDLGGTIILNAKATRLDQDQDVWTAHTSIGSFSARSIILATDSPNTQALLCASEATAPIANTLVFPRGMPTAILRFWYDTQPNNKVEAGIFSGEVVIDNYFWLHRLQDQYIRWSKATGGSAIEVHIYGPPELLAESDALLLTRAAADVQAAFPELRGHLIHQVIQRNDATHTLFGLGRADQHLSTLTPWPDMFACGDWVRHPSPAFFLERACVTGIAAANAVLQSRLLTPWPLLDYAKPEWPARLIEKLMHAGRRTYRKTRTTHHATRDA
ncbi:MAG: FAD-dependent oxidoreductase [Thermoflexales bacterium]|nr:FAD-dependent oxidoreductase [Thermoflexales bacterium]